MNFKYILPLRTIKNFPGFSGENSYYPGLYNCFDSLQQYHTHLVALSRNSIFCLNDPNWVPIVDEISLETRKILTIKHLKTGLTCIFAFDEGHFLIGKSRIVRYMLQLQPEARKLIFFVQYMCHRDQIEVNDYFITILVVFFLQIHAYLPSLEQIQSRYCPAMINGQLDFIFLICYNKIINYLHRHQHWI